MSTIIDHSSHKLKSSMTKRKKETKDLDQKVKMLLIETKSLSMRLDSLESKKSSNPANTDELDKIKKDLKSISNMVTYMLLGFVGIVIFLSL